MTEVVSMRGKTMEHAQKRTINFKGILTSSRTKRIALYALYFLAGLLGSRGMVFVRYAPFGAAAVLMFMVPANASVMVQAIYVFITYNFAVTIVYTALNLPYGAMAVLMTTSQNERTVLNMYRMCIAPIGAVVVTAFTLPMANHLGGDQKAWITISIGYAVISMILLLICFLNCKEQVSEDPTAVADTAVPIGKSIGALFKNRYWLIIAGVFILWGMYFSLNGMMVSYYAQYALGNNERVTLLTLAEKIPLILSVVLVAPFVKKLGKRNCSIAGSVLFLAGAFLMAANPHDLTFLTVGLIVRGLGGGTVISAGSGKSAWIRA